MKPASRYRWFVIGVFFLFMLLHQADQLLIGPLTTPIMDTFKINEVQMGLVTSGALLVGAIFYPLWGYLSDRYSRAKLLALASLIWGSTTWFGAVAPTFPLFIGARASTGIDNSSYPGMYSLVSDYFGPKMRGRVYGLLQVAMPVGYLVGMILALMLGGVLGWRNVFIITGSLGILMAAVIFFGVRDLPRGSTEPEMTGIDTLTKYEFKWDVAKALFKKPSLVLLFLQGFFGIFPWQVITFWFFRYLEKERGYNSDEVLITMVAAIIVLAAGYPIGGMLGDYLFRRTPRGRVIVAAIGVAMGAIFMYITLNIPIEQKILFLGMLSITALFIPFASPNVLSTMYDVTVPEVRSTVVALENFIEQGGSAIAPILAGLIAFNASLKEAILIISISTWILCFLFFLGTIYFIPKDIRQLREQLRERAENDRAHPNGVTLGAPAGAPASGSGT